MKGCDALRPFSAVCHYIKHTDFYLFLIALICSSYSLVLIHSATLSSGSNRYLYVQAAAVIIGIFAFVICSLFDWETLAPMWPWVLGLNVIFQCLLVPFGKNVGGNSSWIAVGPITIQPAEIGKLLFIFSFTAHVTLVADRINYWKNLVLLGLHTLLLMGVIMVTSSDMGMALAYLAICIIMLFAAGLSLKWFACGAVLGVAAIPFVWHVIADYQKQRILVLFDPSINPDISYQTTQSKMAIGAGEMYGSGYMQGNVTQYGNLPAKRTDLIFSVAGEELGFIGAIAIVVLLCLLILRLFYVAYRANDTFSTLLVVGIAGMFLFQTFENIYMCIGLFPVMGLTLPFFSYGGSSVVTMYCAVGIAAGVRMRVKPSWLKQ